MRQWIFLVLVFFLSSCAIATQAGENAISSDPAGALVLLDNNSIGRTPLKVNLNKAVQDRSVDHILTFKKEGFMDTFYTVHSIHDGSEVLGILFPPVWLIHKIIDSDFYYVIETGAIHVVLEPLIEERPQSSPSR